MLLENNFARPQCSHQSQRFRYAPKLHQRKYCGSHEIIGQHLPNCGHQQFVWSLLHNGRQCTTDRQIFLANCFAIRPESHSWVSLRGKENRRGKHPNWSLTASTCLYQRNSQRRLPSGKMNLLICGDGFLLNLTSGRQLLWQILEPGTLDKIVWRDSAETIPEEASWKHNNEINHDCTRWHHYCVVILFLCIWRQATHFYSGLDFDHI